jgi:CheY-like chemotaxis protein
MPDGRVLVIDDDPDIRKMIELALRLDGTRAESAMDGVDALRKLAGPELPSLILLDLMMPGMDGWTFAEKVAADERLRGIPIVIMTAFEESPRPFPPAQGLLRKPMTLGSIRETVGKHLGRG